MKELMFRCWDKKIKKMYRLEHISFGHNKSVSACFLYKDSLNNGFTRFPNDIILMQYIGLKDVKGKYIYENDLFDGRILCGIAWQNIFQVKFINAQFKICEIKGKQEYQANNFPLDKLSIIGNIYENPELLDNLLKS